MQNFTVTRFLSDKKRVLFVSTDVLRSIQPKVAVLLAAHNGACWIQDQLNSILSQEGVITQIFVSIDFSTDETFKIVTEIQNHDNRVCNLDYGQVFGGAAKNFYRLIRDVDFSTYDYVAFADQDDIWLPYKLLHSINEIKSRSLCGYSGNVRAFWEDGRTVLIKKSYPQKRYDFIFEAAGPGCTYVFCSDSLMLFKNFMIRNWHSVNKVAFHDWMVYAYFRSFGLTWFIDPLPLMHYRQHSSNQVGANIGISAYKRRFFLFLTGWYRCEIEKIASLLKLDSPTRLFIFINALECRRRSRDAIILALLAIFFY
jgi:rhamnosyltransferase